MQCANHMYMIDAAISAKGKMIQQFCSIINDCKYILLIEWFLYPDNHMDNPVFSWWHRKSSKMQEAEFHDRMKQIVNPEGSTHSSQAILMLLQLLISRNSLYDLCAFESKDKFYYRNWGAHLGQPFPGSTLEAGRFPWIFCSQVSIVIAVEENAFLVSLLPWFAT